MTIWNSADVKNRVEVGSAAVKAFFSSERLEAVKR
jgi:hypothetical protein